MRLMLPHRCHHIHAKQRVNIGFVKGVVLIAKIAIHRDAALFGDYVAHLCAAQHQQHIAHFAARAGAGKFQIFGGEHARWRFVEQAIKQILRV